MSVQTIYDVIMLRQIVMGFLKPLKVSLGFQSTKQIENHGSNVLADIIRLTG